MPPLLDSNNALLLVIDIQEKFEPVIFNAQQVIQQTGQLIKGCQLLDIPVVVSEQYPKGLGHTVPQLSALFDDTTTVLEKKSFGCGGDPAIETHLSQTQRKQIIICGIEAHVCVNQTVLQLLNQGYEVFLIQDAIGSRQETHYQLALKKMAQLGAIPNCVEMALFELMRTAEHPQFKAVQKLVL